MSDTAVYLVGVTRPGALSAFKQAGFDDTAPARTLHVGRFDALVIDVPRSMFEGVEAEARLKDVRWLAPRAERHDVILQEAMRLTTIMPVGFGGVFSGPEALSQRLNEFADDIEAFLEDAEDAAEYTVRATCDRAHAIARVLGEFQGDGASGAAYLKRKRLEEDAEVIAEERALDALDAFIDDLGETFRGVVERSASNGGDGRWAVGQLSFLVGATDLDAFDQALDAAAEALEAEHGIDLDIAGPWPAYSFCPRLGDDEEDDSAENAGLAA